VRAIDYPQGALVLVTGSDLKARGESTDTSTDNQAKVSARIYDAEIMRAGEPMFDYTPVSTRAGGYIGSTAAPSQAIVTVVPTSLVAFG
jgi:hypothetical protein